MPKVGDVLAGRYQIEAPIGVGGMASVYRARDLRLERDIAIKVLLPNLAADPTLAQRFEREALALAATAHPSIVKVFDVEAGDPATGREPFYVMELCDGGSLADRLAARGRLDPGELVAAVVAVADGLADLHERGFVHRDVKPHNILFDHERARLADFGLARSEEGTELTALTVTGTTVGTLAYLAPELLAAMPATPASDVYALGVVAFQGLTGRLPRPAGSMTELVESRTEPPPTVSSIAPELGTAFDGPVAAALAIDPKARIAPLELADRLTAALSGPRPTADDAATTVVPILATVAAASVDPAAVTLEEIRPASAAVTLEEIRPASAVKPPDQTRVWSGDPRPAIAAIGALGIVVLALFALSMLLGGRDGSTGGANPPATGTSVATSSPTPEPTPPTPVPTLTDDPAAEAYAVLDRVDVAIEALADEDDIRDRDLDALRRHAGDVRNALTAGDYDDALDRTARLDDEVDTLDDRVQGDAMERLKDAVSDLDEAIAAD
jgi:serine/threonine-protein kinase